MMKRMIAIGLFLNAFLLAGRFWQELDAVAQQGAGAGDSLCDDNPELYSLDADGDGRVVGTVTDALILLQWLFQGGPPPQVCLAQDPGIEARVESLEAEFSGIQQGEIGHHQVLTVPSGTTDNWHLFLSNRKMGTKNALNKDPLLVTECYAAPEDAKSWRITARAYVDAGFAVWQSGTANYLLIPR